MTSVRLPAELDQWLTEVAAQQKRSKSFCIKEALIRYLEDMEDLAIALKRSKRKNRKFYTTAELLEHLEAGYKSKRK